MWATIKPFAITAGIVVLVVAGLKMFGSKIPVFGSYVAIT